MKGRKLLITGAAGFTGRHAVQYFAALGAQVTAVLRSSGHDGKPFSIFPEGVGVCYCDLNDRVAVGRMVSATSPDAVLHLAGRNSVPESWQDPLSYMETNVMATLYLLEAMRSLPQSRILVAGSRLKYRPGTAEVPLHPYSLSKTLEELASLAWGALFRQQVLLAEPCNLIGPGPSTGFCSLLARYIAALESGVHRPRFRLSSRHDLRDFLDVRDAVRAYGLILSEGVNGTVYKIDSGKQTSLGEVAEFLIGRASVPVPIDWGQEGSKDLTPDQVRQANQSAGQFPAEHTFEQNISLLGWQPQIKLEQSLADILDDCRNGGEGRLV